MSEDLIITQATYEALLKEYLPDQLHAMRKFRIVDVRIKYLDTRSLHLSFNSTVGGAKFRIYTSTPSGSSGSVYFPPNNYDAEIISHFTQMVRTIFEHKTTRLAVTTKPLSAQGNNNVD